MDPPPPLPSNTACVRCEVPFRRLALVDRCSTCLHFAHRHCTFLLSAEPAEQPNNELQLFSPGRDRNCLTCCDKVTRARGFGAKYFVINSSHGLQLLVQRFRCMQQKRGHTFHTHGTCMSLKMDLQVRGIGTFFRYLWIKEGNGPEDFRRDREARLFHLYEKMPAAIVGKKREVEVMIEGHITSNQGEVLRRASGALVVLTARHFV